MAFPIPTIDILNCLKTLILTHLGIPEIRGVPLGLPVETLVVVMVMVILMILMVMPMPLGMPLQLVSLKVFPLSSVNNVRVHRARVGNPIPLMGWTQEN